LVEGGGQSFQSQEVALSFVARAERYLGRQELVEVGRSSNSWGQ
jgi:hypothetical protein